MTMQAGHGLGPDCVQKMIAKNVDQHGDQRVPIITQEYDCQARTWSLMLEGYSCTTGFMRDRQSIHQLLSVLLASPIVDTQCTGYASCFPQGRDSAACTAWAR